jgi:signal transduction histidine kinase
MKLLYKLSLITLLIAIPTIAVISFFSFTSTRNALESSISDQQFELAQQTMDKIDRLLYERVNNILTIAQDNQVETFLSENTAAKQKDIEISETKLNKFALLTGPWDNLSLVNPKGQIVISLDKRIIGQQIQQQHLSQENLAKVLSGSTYYSDVFIDPNSQKPTMLFAAPIRNEQDPKQTVVGVVVGDLSWPVVLEILQGTTISGRNTELYNSNGVKLGDNVGNLIDSLKAKSNLDPSVSQALSGKNGSKVINDTNQQMLSSYTHEKGYLNFTGNNWILVIETPTSQAFVLAATTAVNSTILLAAIIILSNGLILFFILQFLKPIEILTKTTEQIASGDFTKRVPVRSKDEIGKLAIAFNQMTDKLQDLYKNLEQKIEEKTKQLSEKVADLETTKKGMMNVMEDLESDKAKIDEQKKILDSILANLPVGVALSEAPSGKSIVVNKAGVLLLGRGMDPAAQKDNLTEIYQLFKSDGTPYPVAENPLNVALTEGKASTKDDIVVQRPDNTKMFLRATSVPIKNAKDALLSVVSVFEDITKEHEVDRMKTEFISLASHQLRTPLSAIKWFTEMLLGGDAGPLTPEQSEFAKNVSDSTERMIQLVNSLLNISRIESGRILVDPKPTDLKELVQGVVTDLKAKIAERKQNLIISVHEDLPKINLDPRLIRQVYMNLLTNAIKYTPKEGDISVFISKKDDQIVSQVTDNGYGIPKTEQAKMFQKFFRATNIIKVETDGTGLGMYLIKAIVESSKGKIWFESEEGKGTTFWFSLPMSGMEAKKGEVTLDE